MKTRLKTSFLSAGVALIFLTGCVSSKKYKASQAETAKVRGDSAQLAQQVASLNSNVQDLQGKNNTLQQSLDASNNRVATTQKSLDYYQNYFKEQQSQMSQVSDDVKGALTQAGIANGEVEQVNNAIYVRLDEDELFKKNSMVVTTGGKKALDGLAGVIKSRSNVNVFVGGGDSTSGSMSADNTGASSVAMETPKPKRHHPKRAAATPSGAAGTATGQGSSTVANSTASATPVRKKARRRYSSEGSTAIYNTPGYPRSKAQALKQARMVAVANNFLQNGVPKVNVSLQQSSMTATPDKSIRVIVTPKMDDFNPGSK